MYYNTQILDKYNFVFLDYNTNQAMTRQSVPLQYRVPNTIIGYLDNEGFLHIELFIGTEVEITDSVWIDESNWICGTFVYHKCFNVIWDTDFNTTVNRIPNIFRYKGNVVHITNVPEEDACNGKYESHCTYVYNCLCCNDNQFGLQDNWVEYDFQLIVDDIVKKVTNIFTNIEDNDLGLVTPDDTEIQNMVEDLFVKWLTDAKLQEAVNNWLDKQDIKPTIKEWLDEQDYSIFLKTVMIDWLNNQDLQPIMAEFMATQNIQELINVYMDKFDLTDFIQNAVQEIVNDNSSDIIQTVVTQYLDEYDFTNQINEAVDKYIEENGFDLSYKQDTLVSGENIKTINGESLLGSGNIELAIPEEYITEAPNDNKLYGRQNENWKEVVIPSLTGYATIAQLNDYVKKADLQTTIDGIDDRLQAIESALQIKNIL